MRGRGGRGLSQARELRIPMRGYEGEQHALDSVFAIVTNPHEGL